tara:strand:- start:16 stop:1242 length:1227 start_codon:yes stop_codon:yes gene_type:complete
MAKPNGGLIQETNAQYYAGSQTFLADGTITKFTTTFNTDLIFGNYDPTNMDYAKNNFKLYTSANGLPGTYAEYIQAYTVANNTITTTATLPNNNILVVQLKNLTGGNYGDENAFGNVVEENYGNYSYIKVSELVTNFLVGYVGQGKIIQNVKRNDVIFHVKRALQEFSYDTLPSIKSQEATIPPNLSIPLPQDYVNYVKMSWVDQLGVKHIIYPTTLTSNPDSLLPQDWQGIPVQDNFSEDLDATSLTEDRWAKANDRLINGNLNLNEINKGIYPGSWYGFGFEGILGERYGLNPETSQRNGWFTMNHREGKISFSSNLRDALVIFEYISDGLAYDQDMKVPKMAEEAIYAYVNHAVLSTKVNTPEYIVNRYKREKSAKLRNAKIRLSNIKLDEIVQVMRNKSKWIKS